MLTKLRFLFLNVLLFLAGHLMAQPLSGTYTVGGGGSYATLTTAVADLISKGVNSPVIFKLKTGTFNEQVIIGAIPGASTTNLITFEAESGNVQDVLLTFPSTSTNNYVIRFDNASFITFRNVRIEPTGPTYTRGIHAINTINNVTFENLRITLPATTSVTEERAAILVRPSLSTNIRFINNTITGGSHGIMHVGNNTNPSPGTVFTGNTITNVHYRPAYFQYMAGGIFNSNTIIHSGSSYSDYYGLGLDNTSGYTEIQRNRITGALGHAMRLYYFGGIDTQPSIIANNFFHSNSSYATVYLIYGVTYTNIYHNSINNTSTGEAFHFNRYQSVDNRIVNNIFRANTGYAVEYQTSNAVNSIVESDYNNLFTSGSFIGRNVSTTYGTLNEWQTATGFEANAVSFDPQYQSDINLYASAPGIASAGKNLLSVVPADIDGAPRTATPSLGASQYSAAALTPLAGSYTVGVGQTYTTINAAITAMKVNGISGAVTFLLRTQTFDEQFILPSISGSSATNTITFQSQSGNAADVTLKFTASASATNYVAQLSNASFVTFKNLSFTPDGANYNRAIQVVNRADDLTFENLRITLPPIAAVTEERTAILVRPSLSTNIRFINNTITGGSHGIIHVGNNTNRSPGTVFTGNTITNVYYRPAYFQYMAGGIFNNNTITHSGTSQGDYYGLGLEYSAGYTEIQRNRITGALGHAMRLYYFGGIDTQPSIIANNFFHSNSSYATVYLIYGVTYTNIYHNSINNTSTGEAFHFNRYQSVDNRIVNNIFRANTGYAVEYQTSNAVNSIVESDYNNLFTSGSFIGRNVSTTYGTLNEWQTATGFEANAVSFDPQYQSDINLYASAPGIASAGKNLLSVVPADIDGAPRTATPSLGASQYSAAALTPLAGSYTVGVGQTYTTINAAITAMKVNGISGAVTFLLRTQTFDEQFILPSISGSSATNTITFQSQSGNAADVTLKFTASASATNYVAQLSNASFVTFKNLSFTPDGANYNRAIQVVNRADDLTFENLRITLPPIAAVTEERTAILVRPSLSTNIRFINNTITGGSHGIIHVGNNTNRSPGTVFTGNTITNVYYRPAYFQYMAGGIFNNNTITHSGTSQGDYYGLGLEYSAGYTEIQRNRITGALGHAMRLYYFGGIDTQPSIIANNFFHSNSSYATVYLIYGVTYTNIYHNSINNTSTGEAFHFNRYQSVDNRIVNNIFRANTGYAVEYQTSNAVNSIVESDYNNLFTSGSFIGRNVSTTYGTLNEWQTATGFEANAVSFDPQYQSDINLYASAPGIASAGKNLLSVVPADIDGAPRTATPSLGASQYSAAALTPLAGSYTVGVGQTYTTINAAITAMKVNGISGAVTFLLRTQTFDEQFILPSISGSSATNTITFQSQSGNAADVTLKFTASASATNYVAQLSNASFVTFKNLSFTPDGANYNRAIQVVNRADDLTFENLRITLPPIAAVTEERTAILVRPSLSTNIRFINNTITGGSHGIIHVGNNTNRSPGTVFTGNTITNVYYRPAYFQYMAGGIFNNNTITHSGTSQGDYYGLGLEYSAGYTEIQRNRITGALGHAMRLYYFGGIDTQPSIIANNFFHSNSSYATVYLIYGVTYTNIYHNSINNTSTGEAFHFNRYQSVDNRIVNNIFRANTGYAVEYQTSNAVNSIVESDYNNLFTSGSFIGRNVSTTYGTLNEWQTATGFEANSLSIDPQYQSNTVLYTAVSALSNIGKNVNTIVPDDIDGIARPSTPSIGANQFGSSGTPLSGDYTINASGSGSNNFTTVTTALDALKNFGISGPVTFKIAGDFNEQLTFLAVSGSSPTNTITFESATGLPENAIIRFTSTTAGSNFTIRLSNADYHRLKNLTVKAEGTTYGRAIHAINRTINLELDGNIIESVVTTSTSADRSGLVIASAQSQNVRIVNNTVRFGAVGIDFQGPTSKATGTIVQNNLIFQSYHRGIMLDYHTAFVLDKNQVSNNPSSGSFQGITIANVAGEYEVTANKVTGGNATALNMYAALAPVGTPALIANNFFQSNNGSGYETVYLNYIQNVNFYHNNINATGVGTGLYYVSGSGQNINLINNNIKSNGYSIDVINPAAIDQINYNNYFTSGATLARWNNVDRPTLIALQGATGQDANSLSVDPQYQSSSDLTTLASSIAGAGFDLTAVVPTDINSSIRTIPVSIGATQYSAAFAKDGSLSRIITPLNSCSLTNATDVRVEITNLGAASISGLQVAYQINGGTPVVEPIPGTIVPAGKQEYTFTQKADLSVKQAYTVKAYIILVGDENITNDQLETTITHFPDLITTLTANSTICKSTTITLTAAGGTQYVWNTGATAASITVSPLVTTTYTVIITNTNGCSETKSVIVTVKEIPLISYTNDLGYTSSYVSPTQGGSDLPFDFRVIYTDTNGNLPANGYPRVELDANNNGQATDPLDIIRVMQEADVADVDVTDGKEYRITITNLSDQISWRSRIVASSIDGCSAQTPFTSQPFVSNDLLDVAIYANDISFSKSNPAINESIKIYARIRNTSDFLAENFVVSAYIENVLVFTQTVLQVNPQASITLQWDQVLAASGFYPVKLVIDETNVLSEDNELNNFAIRPVLVGDYQLPGGINPVADASPLTMQPGSIITITGKAEYFGIDPTIDPDVAGATVIVRITGGSAAQTTTLADGTYQLGVQVPSVAGTYTLNVEVTDYTLTGYQGPITFTVLPAPPLPDLSTIITLAKSTILPGEQITGTAIIQNVGDIAATNFVFRYLNCDAILGEHVIAQLNPGESLTYQFTTTTNVIGDCFNRNNCLFKSEADLNNQVVEKTKINNQSAAYLTVLPDKPDLTPNNPNNASIPGSINMLNPFTFYVRVDNIGGVDANTAFDVNVYMDAVLIRTESLTSLSSCTNHLFTVTHNFADILDHVVTIRVDEPIGSGNVDEYRESNNEFSKIIKHIPPPLQYPNLNVSNRDISVTPVLPPTGTDFSIDVVYRNNGAVPIVAPFDLELTVIENGIPRIETQTVNSGMAVGATKTATLTTNLQSDGDHAFRIRLDNSNIITEDSEGDNVAQMPLCVDFAVNPGGGVWGGGFYVNTVQNLTASIYNNGLFTATNVPVTFYLDNVLVGSATLPVVGSGIQVGGYSVSIPFLFDQVGTFELKVVVDELNAYTECREDNNEYKANIQVRVPAPDLRVFSEYISPSKINPDVNEPITIFLSYDNIGIGATGPFNARILVDDVPLGADITIPSVLAGEDGTVQVTTPYTSSTAGIRIIRALLDPDNLLTETTKTNNEASRALVVGKAPNLLFTDLQSSIACPLDGDDVVITATLFNSGDLDATADVHFFYITDSDTIPIDIKQFTLAGSQSISIQTNWLVINKNYSLYGEIRSSDPEEFDLTDNTILTKLCGGPYYNLLVSAEGQGIVQKTPNLNRYEGVQQVEITASPATGWDFIGWQGDATGTANPLILNLTSDRNISARFSQTTSIPIVQNGDRCGAGAVTLGATGATGTETYEWYTQAVGGNPISGATNSTFVTPSIITTTSYFVLIKSVSNESPRMEVVATINPVPAQPTITVIGETSLCPEKQESVTLVATSGLAEYAWSNSETTEQIVVTSAGTYSVTVTNTQGCDSEVSTAVTIALESCTELIVYNGISFNNDQLNSYLQIKNIDAFPDTRSNELKIYNRWGDMVFEARDYDNLNNKFTGLNKNGDKLPSGTYFYLLKFDSGRESLSGYLELK
jgi:hypothetical protein